jgi:hypothetical protein
MTHRVVLIAVCLLVVAAPQADAFDLNLSVGADFGGDFDLGDISVSADTGYSLGLEIAFKVPFVELGAGLEYGLSRGAKSFDFSASYYHLYGIGRMYFGPVYIAARLGYHDVSFSGLFDGSVDGGSTWALGGGVEFFEKVKLELLFNNLGGDLSYQSWTIRALYTF